MQKLYRAGLPRTTSPALVREAVATFPLAGAHLVRRKATAAILAAPSLIS